MCTETTVSNCCDCPRDTCAEYETRCSEVPDAECWETECEDCPASVNHSYVAP
ncbi:MAG: hypothetical protein WC977_13835 [Anaerovoracaceae bacterium]|jgi:hypothetical protein